MKGIISITCAPLRTNCSEQSEMSSQLLFGEQVEILETQERWLRVRNLTDSYEGWIDKKTVHILSPQEEKELSAANFKHTQQAFVFYKNKNNAEQLPIVGGSPIPFLKGTPVVFANKKIELPEADFKELPKNGAQLVKSAKQYLNSPYLWGGKTILGIDCSGLVQVVFSMVGIQLPRDANQQVEQGEIVNFLSEAQAGDLAFFENEEGKIIHVGILINSHEIIHASGWVKIDRIDSQGIFSAEKKNHTHRLRIIKRIA